MSNPSRTPESLELPALAGELRISLSKLIRRLREQSHPHDFTSSQKSVLLRLDRDGPSTVSALARAESVRPQSMRVTVAAHSPPSPLNSVTAPPGCRRSTCTWRAAVGGSSMHAPVARGWGQWKRGICY